MSRWYGFPAVCVAAIHALLFVTTADAYISVEPECPATTDAITIDAYGPTVQLQPLSLAVAGTTIKLVAQAYNSGFTLPPFTEVRGVVPPLAAGKYRIEFYTRTQPNNFPGGDPATLSPERFEEAKDFEVFQIPPTCSPVNIEVVGAAYRAADVNEDFPDALRFRVSDAHGNPVPNWSVPLQRAQAPSEAGTSLQLPDLAQVPPAITTGQDGVASLAGKANQVPGAFQYRAYLYVLLGDARVAYGTFYNRPMGVDAPNYPVIEFRRRTSPVGLEHFFMTGNMAEAAKLDRTPNWTRTGEIFMTFAPGSDRPGTSTVCRFYGLPSAGLDSHFFSAAPEECAAVAQRFGHAWQLETTDAFEAYLPNRETGECPQGTRKLYRAYNNQPDANHRYAFTQDIALRNAYPYGGTPWSLEGYGLEAVVMCLPQ